MWGALIGLAGTAIGSILSNSASKKKADEAKAYLDKKETRANNAYNYQRGMNEASIMNVLSRNKDNMAEQLGYVSGVEGVLGGNGSKTAQLAQQAIKGNVEAAGNASTIVANTNNTAYQGLQNTLNSIDDQRVKISQGEAEATAKAGQNLSTAFLGLAQDDLTSHLENGRGLFESAFGKVGSSSKTNTINPNSATYQGGMEALKRVTHF